MNKGMTAVSTAHFAGVRAKPMPRQRRLSGVRLVLLIALATAAAATGVWYEWYYGPLGLFYARPVVEERAYGRVIRVPPGGNLQAAVDMAQSGDIVELKAGAAYSGTLTLHNKPLTDFVTIRSSAAADLAADKRLTLAQLPFLARIESGMLTRPAVDTAAGAHHYRFVGIEFGPTTKGYYNIIQIGTTEETSLADLPHHIEFDHVYLHGSPEYGQRRGIAANGRSIKITNSYFSDFKREGDESQAIAIWASDGPFEIVNNYLEAAAENILLGGAQNKLGLVPSDCLIKDNWMSKPVEWRGSKWTVKNFLEIKSGRRVRIENNLFTNNWEHAQEGAGILFRTGADSGPQAVVEDVQFVSNVVRGSGSAINIFGDEGQGGRNLVIRNNIFEDINSIKWGGRGFFIMSTAFENVVVENNAVIQDGSITIAYGKPVTGLIFRNNIVFNNLYGFFGDGLGVGKVALARYFPGAIVANNAIIGGSLSDYGPSYGPLNFYPSKSSDIGFRDPSKGDYRLRPDDRYSTKGIGPALDPSTVGGR